MRDIVKLLAAGLILIGSAQFSTARAATARMAAAGSDGPTRVLHRAQIPPKSETCKAKWPYVVLICVA